MFLHASCVAFRRRTEGGDEEKSDWSGVLIRGPSGGGKSAFALRLIALGATLVSDDQTVLRRAAGERVEASAPDRLFGVVEARGLGLLRLDALRSSPVDWVVELRMGGAEGRLPPLRTTDLLGVETPVLALPDDERAAAALCCLVRGGALLDPEADLADLKVDRARGGGEA